MANQPVHDSAPGGDYPERRIRRGCLTIIFLLAMVAGFNFLQYGFNIIVIVALVLFVVAVIGWFVLAREGRG